MSLQSVSVKSTVELPVGMPGFLSKHVSFDYPQRLASFKSLPIADHTRFASHLALYIPEAAMRIDEGDYGVLHLEVGALKLETRDAISRRNWDAAREHYVFVSMILENASTELRDAILISYLGSLFYGEMSLNYAKARSLLPRNLALALAAIEEHYEGLVS